MCLTGRHWKWSTIHHSLLHLEWPPPMRESANHRWWTRLSVLHTDELERLWIQRLQDMCVLFKYSLTLHSYLARLNGQDYKSNPKKYSLYKSVTTHNETLFFIYLKYGKISPEKCITARTWSCCKRGLKNALWLLLGILKGKCMVFSRQQGIFKR